MACLAGAARRTLAQRAWRASSSYDDKFQEFVRARGVRTHMEWFQSFVVRYMLARAVSVNGVAMPPNRLRIARRAHDGRDRPSPPGEGRGAGLPVMCRAGPGPRDR